MENKPQDKEFISLKQAEDIFQRSVSSFWRLISKWKITDQEKYERCVLQKEFKGRPMFFIAKQCIAEEGIEKRLQRIRNANAKQLQIKRTEMQTKEMQKIKDDLQKQRDELQMKSNELQKKNKELQELENEKQRIANEKDKGEDRGLYSSKLIEILTKQIDSKDRQIETMNKQMSSFAEVQKADRHIMMRHIERLESVEQKLMLLETRTQPKEEPVLEPVEEVQPGPVSEEPEVIEEADTLPSNEDSPQVDEEK